MFKVTFGFHICDSGVFLCFFFRVHAPGFADPGSILKVLGYVTQACFRFGV